MGRPTVEQQVDPVKLAVMRIEKGMTFPEIGKVLGISKQGAHQRFRTLAQIFDPESIEAYERNKPSILSAVEKTLLMDILDPAKREKASLNNTAYALQQVYQANRTTRGLSSSITEHRQAYDIEISMVDSEIKRLESRFSGTKQNNGAIDAEYDDAKNTMSCKGSK